MTGENALRRRLTVENRRNRPNRTIESFFLFFIISFYFIYLFIYFLRGRGRGGGGGKRAKYVVRGESTVFVLVKITTYRKEELQYRQIYCLCG